MITKKFYCVTIAYVLLFVISYSQQQPASYQYPAIDRSNVSDTLFGKVIHDPYRFLENSEDPRTKEFIRAQADFLGKQKREIKNENGLSSELTEKSYADFNPLSKQGKYYFVFIYDGYGPASLYCQSEIYGGRSLVASVADFRHPEKGIPSIAGFRLSGDDRYVAISLSFAGSDWTEIRVIDMKSKKKLNDKISWVRFSNIYWKDKGFFYCRYDAPDQTASVNPIKNRKLYYHVLGTDEKEDKLIYEIPTTSYAFFAFEVSFDQSTLFIYSTVTVKGQLLNAILTKNLDEPEANFFKQLIVWPHESKYYYGIIHKEGSKVYVISNREGFSNSVLEFDINKSNTASSLIPPAKQKLEGALVANNKIVCLYSNGYENYFVIYNLQGEKLNVWGIPPGAVVQSIYGDPSSKELIYCFESYYYPSSFYTADLTTFTRKPVSGTGISFRTDNLTTEYVEVTSRDGTSIPMFITHKRNLKKDGTNPCLLYSYGGFGVSMRPHFDPMFQVFYENGGIVAVPCIRGGGEKDGWHDAGRKLNKNNSINDFIDAARYLINEKYTSADRLASNGASNGGLLVAAAMLRQPQLFRAVVAEVGVYDMLRFQQFTGGYLWKEEYGLSSDSVEFENLLTYSPLHNIKNDTDYPATLVITGDHDNRVPPLHSLKFIAALQNTASKRNPYLLYMQERAGHSGSSKASDELKKEAFKLAFIFHHMGIKKIYRQPRYK